MKAGTTTLFDHLAGHPGVAASRDKEPKYFARDAVYAQGPEWYDGLWDWDPSTHSIAMEASTHYSFRHIHPATAERMAAHPGEFRIVYLVREPIARIESHYHHALAAGWKVADHPFTAPLHNELVDPCRYAWQLEPYVERFGKEAILVLTFEDLVADAEGSVRRVLDHWSLPVQDVAIDAELVRNSSSDKVVSTRVHSARKLPGSAWLSKKVSPEARRKVKSLIGSGKPAPRLDDATRAAVRADLAEDHARLAAEWGVDTVRWAAED